MKFSEASIQKMQNIARKHHISLIYLFGSAARGDEHAESDVDFAMQFERPLTYADLKRIIMEMGALVELRGREIDIVDLSRAKPLVTYFVLSEGVLLYGSEKNDDEMYRSGLKRYFDMKPIYEYQKEKLNAEIGV